AGAAAGHWPVGPPPGGPVRPGVGEKEVVAGCGSPGHPGVLPVARQSLATSQRRQAGGAGQSRSPTRGGGTSAPPSRVGGPAAGRPPVREKLLPLEVADPGPWFLR